MLREFADKYYLNNNYNCTETLIHAANEYYKLVLDENAMKLMGGFGGGIQTGSLCGAFLGAVGTLSIKYIKTKAHESDDIKPAVTLLTERFKKEFDGKILCCDIKEICFTEENRCRETVLRACDVLEKVIAEYEVQQ